MRRMGLSRTVRLTATLPHGQQLDAGRCALRGQITLSHLTSPGQNGRSRVSVTQQCASERVNAERGALRRARRLDPEARRRASRGCARDRRRRAHLPRLRGRHRAARTPVMASRRSSPRSTSRPTATCTSASWSGRTSRTSRSAGGSPSSRRAAPASSARVLVNSGAEAIENAVKIARVATGRPAVVVFDNAFHGRTLLTMTMTSKVKPYKAGFGPFAPEVYRTPAPYPVPRDHVGRRDRRARASLQGRCRPGSRSRASCSSRYRARAASSRCRPIFPRGCWSCAATHGILYVDDEVQSGIGRTGKMWAIEHYEGVEPDLLVSGKSLGGGLPLAGVTGRAEVMDAVPPGGLGGTFGGNPLSCAAALAVLDAVAQPEFLGRGDALGEHAARAGSTSSPRGHDSIGEVRGLGPMLAFEFAERTPDRAQAVVAAAFERVAAAARVRPLRERDPPAAAADDRRRRARRRAGDPGGGARRRWLLTRPRAARRQRLGAAQEATAR